MPLHSNTTDYELLVLVSKGDQEAFQKLFYHYHHLIGGFVYKITGSRDMSEEIVQDVFIKIWIRRETLSEVTNFKSWLFTIAKNHTLNCIRELIKVRNLKKELSSLNESECEYDERMDLIEQAIRKLPPQQQKVFMLSRFQHLKYNEIAKEMNISRETVKSYLHIAHTSIMKFVSRRFTQCLLFALSIFF